MPSPNGLAGFLFSLNSRRSKGASGRRIRSNPDSIRNDESDGGVALPARHETIENAP